MLEHIEPALNNTSHLNLNNSLNNLHSINEQKLPRIKNKRNEMDYSEAIYDLTSSDFSGILDCFGMGNVPAIKRYILFRDEYKSFIGVMDKYDLVFHLSSEVG